LPPQEKAVRRLVLAAVLAATIPVAGCSGATMNLSRELDSGRHVVISSTRFTRKMWFDSTFESTTATIGPRKVTVEPTRVELDGDWVATIDEATKRVTIEERDGKLRIVADGATVYEGTL
jgi:hypothetical protein